MFSYFRVIFSLIKESKLARYLFIIPGIFILLFIIFMVRYCSESQTEKNLDNLKKIESNTEVNSVISEVNGEVQQRKVNQIRANVDVIKKRAVEIQSKKKSNVNFEEANRLRCEAYPDERGCY